MSTDVLKALLKLLRSQDHGCAPYDCSFAEQEARGELIGILEAELVDREATAHERKEAEDAIGP